MPHQRRGVTVERAAFVLVRLLAIFVASQVVLRVAAVINLGFPLGRDLANAIVPYAVVAVGAIILWFAATPIARKISLDTYRWLPLEEEEEDEEGQWLRQIPISIESILAAAIIVAGTVFAVEGVVSLVSAGFDIFQSQPFGAGFFDEPELSIIDRLHAVSGRLISSSLLLALGLWLMFGTRAIAAPIRRLRDWYALESTDEDASR